MMSKPDDPIKEGKNIAIMAYFTFVGTLIAWSLNSDNTGGREKNGFASFHIRQNIGLNIVFFVLGILVTGANSLLVTVPFWVFFSVLWFFGFTGALNGKLAIIPIFGILFQKWFKKIA